MYVVCGITKFVPIRAGHISSFTQRQREGFLAVVQVLSRTYNHLPKNRLTWRPSLRAAKFAFKFIELETVCGTSSLDGLRALAQAPDFSRADADPGPRRHELEKLHDVLVAHAYAPDRTRLPHRDAVGTAVDVDVAPHGVDLAQPVPPRLATRQPQDAREDPVAAGKALGHFRRPDLPGRAAPDKDGVDGMICADFRAHDVFAARSAETSLLLARPVARGRDEVALERLALVAPKRERFLRNGDFNRRHSRPRPRAAPRRIPRAAY